MAPKTPLSSVHTSKRVPHISANSREIDTKLPALLTTLTVEIVPRPGCDALTAPGVAIKPWLCSTHPAEPSRLSPVAQVKIYSHLFASPWIKAGF